MNLGALLPEEGEDAFFGMNLVQRVVAMLAAILTKLGIGYAMPL